MASHAKENKMGSELKLTIGRRVSPTYNVEIEGQMFDATDLCNLMDEAASGDILIRDKTVSEILSKMDVLQSSQNGGWPAAKGKKFREFHKQTRKLREQVIEAHSQFLKETTLERNRITTALSEIAWCRGRCESIDSTVTSKLDNASKILRELLEGQSKETG